MDMLIRILIFIIAYFVLLFLSINLLGFLLRGLFSNPELDKLKIEGDDFIKKEVVSIERADRLGNFVGIIMIIVFFYALFHFWNIGVVVCAIIIMLGRIPDVLWEIKNGKKLTYAEIKNLSHGALYFISAISPLIVLPVLYYSLYYL